MTFLEDRDLEDVPNIPEYYKGKTIFITGGSGFMGKVLIEKLLYSCTDLDRIYLLLRSKKNVAPEDRLAKIYSSHCFDRLRKEKPGVFQSKVFFISGDISETGLGISDEDRTLLVNRTHIIFHAAASVRFDDSLKTAAKLNLVSTKEVIELATEVRNLECLIHVSTAYSNTNRNPIEEVMYPAHVSWREMLQVCEEVDDHTLQVLTPKYIGELPNTYVFTKQLAEHVAYEYKGKLPIVIIRPSIVISSHEDPFPGWIDNFNGPSGLIVGCGKGILRTIYSSPDMILDYVPVDITIRACIVASWIRGTKMLTHTDDIPIYNSCAGTLKNITIQEMLDIGNEIIEFIPLDNVMWTSNVIITKSLFMYNIYVLILHLLPAIFFDLLLRIFGKKPMLLKIQRHIYVSNLAIRYFITQQWTFTNTNLINLRSKVKEVDREQFYYEMENIDIFEFFKNSIAGGRKYLLKEKDEDIPKAMAHRQRIIILDKLLKFIFFGLVFWWLLNTNFIKNIFMI
ncbi:fatty acyl-CoA reductase 1-like [Nymphalis io]|uniref:fatty acyl-CoA reductase 1-like n=1 Tax=Inachis io TaxID=171585 RepID=UPI0021683B8C|nr:fatty acyl-CoA reductase 1-like [Nymphalis io]XP_050358541.1 fatty acyl-CoA reductase 1-like [Nymphalis io]